MEKKILYGMMAAGLLFTGCSSDDLINSGGVAEDDQTMYISMTIHGDNVGGSRASAENGSPDAGPTDFSDGAGRESTIQTAYFVFYDADGFIVGDIVPIDLASAGSEGAPVVEVQGPDGSTIEKSYRSVVPVTVRKGEKVPTQVICYINPTNVSNLRKNLSEIQTVTVTGSVTGTGNTQLFPMSNSVYYPADPEIPGTNTPTDDATPTIAVQIPEGGLFKTETEARDALTAAFAEGASAAAQALIVNVYVERYAVKLSFTQPSSANINTYQTATRVYSYDAVQDKVTSTAKKVELKFAPTYWAVNAMAKTSYVIKSYREESATGSMLPDNYGYEELNDIINAGISAVNDSWKWNNPSYSRSYWGMSPAYFTQDYPDVASDLAHTGEGATIVYSDTETQKYIPYNQLTTLGFPVTSTETPAKDSQYFNETTVGSRALAESNPAAAVASVIFTGQYSVSVDGTTAPGNPGFYSYLAGSVSSLYPGITEERPFIYFENDPTTYASKVTGGGTMLDRMILQASILYTAVYDEAGNEITGYRQLEYKNTADLARLRAALEVGEVSDAVKILADGDDETKLKLQDNTRTLKFKSVNAANEKNSSGELLNSANKGIYVSTDKGFLQVVADGTNSTTEGKTLEDEGKITFSKANLYLMQQVGYAYYYKTGLAYFNIPVKHLGWYRKGNSNRTLDGTTYKDNAVLDWSKVLPGDFGMVRNHVYEIEVESISGLATGIGNEKTPIVPPATPTDYYVSYAVHILKWAIVPKQSVKL